MVCSRIHGEKGYFLPPTCISTIATLIFVIIVIMNLQQTEAGRLLNHMQESKTRINYLKDNSNAAKKWTWMRTIAKNLWEETTGGKELPSINQIMNSFSKTSNSDVEARTLFAPMIIAAPLFLAEFFAMGGMAAVLPPLMMSPFLILIPLGLLVFAIFI